MQRKANEMDDKITLELTPAQCELIARCLESADARAIAKNEFGDENMPLDTVHTINIALLEYSGIE